MSEHNITVQGGSSVRLPTAGKYCDRDIVVTAEGGGTELPELGNPASEAEVFDGYEYIDGTGVKKSGTFTAEEEIAEQDSLIAEILAELEGKAAGGGVSYDVLKSILDRSVSAYSDRALTALGAYAFSGCTKLTEVTLPKLETVGNYALNGCTALTKVHGSALTLGNYAFAGCTALEEIDTDRITTIATYAFQNCKALTNGVFPAATSVAAYAFTGCSGIKHLSLPSLKSMVANAFRGMSVTSVDMPNVTNLGNNSFRGVTTLTRATFPRAASSSSEAMRGCTNLVYVDLPVFATFGTSTFYGCTKLEAVILRNTAAVAKLTNVSSFTGTAISNGSGYIYVPAALVDSYKAAAYWSTFAEQIRAIEDYPEITGG